MKNMDFDTWKSDIEKALNIAEDILKDFDKVDVRTKKGLSMFNTITRMKIDEVAEDGKPSKKELTEIEKQFFTFWRGAVFVEVEEFWVRLKQEGIAFERGETKLQELLRKGRLNSVETWIQLLSNYKELQNAGYIDEAYTKDEQSGIEKLMSDKVLSCKELLENILNKGKVAKSGYIKFINAYNTLEQSNHLNENFDDSQIAQLKKLVV